MYNLRVTGAMTFPHYLQHEVGEKVTVSRKAGVEKKDGKLVDKYEQFVAAKDGIYTIVCNPERLVKVGE